MNDDELESAVRTALHKRFATSEDVALLARLEPRPASASSRLRLVLATAATVAAVVALSIVLALRHTSGSQESASATPLTGVTWQGPGPNLTVVFTEQTVRIYDGCQDQLREVTIGDGVLDIGRALEPVDSCGGHPRPGGQADLTIFDDVLGSSHLMWRRSGDALQLTNEHGQSVDLHVAGSAPQLTSQTWILERFVDSRAETHEGDYGAARLLIDSGTVYASDLCNDLTGSATVTDTTITFADMHTTERACIGQIPLSVADAVDHVLSGTVSYRIRGDELILTGPAELLLVYTPAN